MKRSGSGRARDCPFSSATSEGAQSYGQALALSPCGFLAVCQSPLHLPSLPHSWTDEGDVSFCRLLPSRSHRPSLRGRSLQALPHVRSQKDLNHLRLIRRRYAAHPSNRPQLRHLAQRHPPNDRQMDHHRRVRLAALVVLLFPRCLCPVWTEDQEVFLLICGMMRVGRRPTPFSSMEFSIRHPSTAGRSSTTPLCSHRWASLCGQALQSHYVSSLMSSSLRF